MEFDVVVEISKEQRNKYEVDHEKGQIRLPPFPFDLLEIRQFFEVYKVLEPRLEGGGR
jgi:hypothetical protein